jgi:hypothetical protein
MATDAETARKVHIVKLLRELKKIGGYDGVVMLAFGHTDDAPRLMTYEHTGIVPPMEEVLMAIGRLIACTAYTVGKKDAENEQNQTGAPTNLDGTISVT